MRPWRSSDCAFHRNARTARRAQSPFTRGTPPCRICPCGHRSLGTFQVGLREGLPPWPACAGACEFRRSAFSPTHSAVLCQPGVPYHRRLCWGASSHYHYFPYEARPSIRTRSSGSGRTKTPRTRKNAGANFHYKSGCMFGAFRVRSHHPFGNAALGPARPLMGGVPFSPLTSRRWRSLGLSSSCSRARLLGGAQQATSRPHRSGSGSCREVVSAGGNLAPSAVGELSSRTGRRFWPLRW